MILLTQIRQHNKNEKVCVLSVFYRTTESNVDTSHFSIDELSFSFAACFSRYLWRTADTFRADETDKGPNIFSCFRHIQQAFMKLLQLKTEQ